MEYKNNESYSFENNSYNGMNIGLFTILLYIFSNIVADCRLFPQGLQQLFLYIFILIAGLNIIANRKISFNGYIKYYLIFTVASFVFMFRGSEINLFSGEFYSIIVCFIIIYCISYFSDSPYAVYAISVCYVLASVIVVVVLFYRGQLVGSADSRLGQGNGGNANTFATAIMYAVIYCFFLILTTRNIIVKGILLAIVLFDYYALVLSGGRKFFVIPLVFFFIFFYLKSDQNGRRYRSLKILFIIISIIIIFKLIMNTPVLYNAVGIRLEQLLNGITGKGEADLSSIIRKQMRSLAITYWKERPLFGYGLDMFKYLSNRELGLYCYSHCNYTELLYSGGLVYLFSYYSYFVSVIKNIILFHDEKSVYICFVIAGIISQLLFDYGGVTYSLLHSQIFLLSISILLSYELESLYLNDEDNYN